MRQAPGIVRDSIVEYLGGLDDGDASIAQIVEAVKSRIGQVPDSSVRSYLNLNTPGTFERTTRGHYKMVPPIANGQTNGHSVSKLPAAKRVGKARLYNADCFAWLAQQPAESVQAVVTDPPYGLVEYTDTEKQKLRNGKGGIWRVPPSFDGHRRAPLPRFTVLTPADHLELHAFFKRFGAHLARVTVPGANIVVASNPLLVHIVASAMAESGLELRGYIARQVMTMRGGDRPKNAHEEFDGVSVLPRSQWEPWVILRRPLQGRVQDNLRKWGTGGFRRLSDSQPFGDVIRSSPTPASERKIAPHPSLKPQAFMRQLVRAVLPLGTGQVLDPFMGAGSTLAAANAVGYESIGIEMDENFYRMATGAVAKLAKLSVTV